MKLSQFPRLKCVCDLLGIDNGADTVPGAAIPKAWRLRVQLAEDELVPLSDNDLHILARGEHTERSVLAAKVPNAEVVILAAFDGELTDLFFRPWRGIYDARRAEKRMISSAALAATEGEG